MKRLSAILVVVLSLSLVLSIGCTKQNTVTIEGTVRYLDLEGGFWGIVGSDGKNYDPVNLNTKYQTDGQLVKVEAEILEDQASIHQRGTLIKISSIEVITTTIC
jgi:hypothetical protein